MIAQVAQGDSDDVGPEFLDDAFSLGQVVVGEHQVNHLDLVPLVVQVRRDIRQPDGHGLGVHPAVHPVLAVGSDEQDTHCILHTCPAVWRRAARPIMDYAGGFDKDGLAGTGRLQGRIVIPDKAGIHSVLQPRRPQAASCPGLWSP